MIIASHAVWNRYCHLLLLFRSWNLGFSPVLDPTGVSLAWRHRSPHETSGLCQLFCNLIATSSWGSLLRKDLRCLLALAHPCRSRVVLKALWSQDGQTLHLKEFSSGWGFLGSRYCAAQKGFCLTISAHPPQGCPWGFSSISDVQQRGWRPGSSVTPCLSCPPRHRFCRNSSSWSWARLSSMVSRARTQITLV